MNRRDGTETWIERRGEVVSPSVSWWVPMSPLFHCLSHTVLRKACGQQWNRMGSARIVSDRIRGRRINYDLWTMARAAWTSFPPEAQGVGVGKPTCHPMVYCWAIDVASMSGKISSAAQQWALLRRLVKNCWDHSEISFRFISFMV